MAIWIYLFPLLSFSLASVNAAYFQGKVIQLQGEKRTEFRLIVRIDRAKDKVRITEQYDTTELGGLDVIKEVRLDRAPVSLIVNGGAISGSFTVNVKENSAMKLDFSGALVTPAGSRMNFHYLQDGPVMKMQETVYDSQGNQNAKVVGAAIKILPEEYDKLKEIPRVE